MMTLQITNKTENPLLSRTEIAAHVTFDSVTPTNDNISDQIAKSLSSKKECVAVKKINTLYGKREADIAAYVYSSPEEKKRIEPRNKKQIEAEAKAKEEAAKKAQEEAKAEEKKE